MAQQKKTPKKQSKTLQKIAPKKAATPKKRAVASKKPPKTHRLRKWLLIIGGIILVIGLTIYISFIVSPWPGSLLIRHVFEKGAAETSQKLEKHVPSGVAEIKDQQYKEGDKDAYLDVYYPEHLNDSERTLPTIVWIHGGAWVSGNKNDVANYSKILASHDYTVVAVNYSIAPEHQYPTPVGQVMQALKYVEANAERLHVNVDQIVLAGDSAGSQIAAQVATIITNSEYAQKLKTEAPIDPAKLRGTLLNCGAYDLALPNYDGEDGKFLKTVLWAYSGEKDFLNDPNMKLASVVDYVNGDFPATFITAGNDDPLEPQSKEFAQKLKDLNVTTDELFYADDHEPALPHEYQFNLDTDDGKQALERMLTFLARHTQR